MSFTVIDHTPHIKGSLFRIEIQATHFDILFTHHAFNRMVKWKISMEMVTETLLFPEEVLIGHHDRFIAHRCFGSHVLRVVYEYDYNLPVLITVYFPSKQRYFQGGGTYEDRIFPRY